jgi:dipeptidyl aminopeptidase/acylaminoacyl peptidase
MFRRFLLTLSVTTLLFTMPVGVSGQPAHQEQVTGKKVLDHDAYDIWRSIRSSDLTPDGRWLTFRYVPGKGDAELIIRRTDTDEVHSIARGEAASLTEDGRFAVFTVKPAFEEVQTAKRAKKKPADMPKDTLAVLRLGDTPDTAFRVGALKSFKLPESAGGFVAYLIEPQPVDEAAEEEAAQAPEEEPTEPEEPEEEEEKEEKPERGEGALLVLRDLESGSETRFEDVSDYGFTADGAYLVFARVTEEGDGDGVFLVETGSGAVTALHEGMGRYKRLTTAEEGHNVAFLTDAPDWDADEPTFTLMVATAGDGPARVVAATGTQGIPDGWVVSADGSLEFSRTGRRVFFGSAPEPQPEPEDTLLAEEKVRVDIWSWTDPLLQPMQLLQADDERSRTYQAVAHLDRGDRVVQLAHPDLPEIRLADEGEADVAMAYSNLPYRQLISWDASYYDVSVVDLASGDARPVVKGVRGFSPGLISPTGRYVAWWDGSARAWMAASTTGGGPVNLSANIPHPTWDVLDDHPQDPPPESFPVWTEGDREVLVADQYDLWVVDPATGEARSMTEGMGRREGMQFRYAQLDRDERGVPRDRDIHLRAFHLTTKASGVYRDRVTGSREPARLAHGDVQYGLSGKADDADVVLVTMSTFQEYPDLHVTDSDFSSFRKVSEANPQQAEYSWGTAELVDWVSADGIPLQGILYKPEGFDPSRKYPMMVYFYERSSDGLHFHQSPAPGSSSINRSFYVSRGYVLFVPDIPYKIGWPGESAMNAVVPGILQLLDQGFVDPDRIGVQGHSWGGYQIAYMVTRTNLFAAAEAGAPVSNMTSAYGGIRWASGMSRMFQYERTQSRIGGTLWDAQHRYISNSPLFQADKVETPLLMMHNDEDGAVPWEQGIEYFVALRRLGKPVWMLNYNGEAHGLRQRQNQVDWTIRMQQFFDHFLLDAPAPVWIAEGVPAIAKGRTMGLELVEQDQSPKTGGDSGGK